MIIIDQLPTETTHNRLNDKRKRIEGESISDGIFVA
jgi:hypothetical protein